MKHSRYAGIVLILTVLALQVRAQEMITLEEVIGLAV
jgi:hypothetical protein